MKNNFYVEVNSHQKSHHKSKLCGDVFLSKRIKEENRVVLVLSDGMGHGVKANLLATLTATMALNFTIEHKEESKIAETIMNTLPECSERKISYSTFSIIDIDAEGKVKILQYDNPLAMAYRGNQQLELHWQCMLLSGNNQGKEIYFTSFYPRKEDRIVLCTDGVSQAGLGVGNFAFGWGDDNVKQFIKNIINQDLHISAKDLAFKVVAHANKLDNYTLKDDTSVAVIYFRNPRRLLLCSGPPFTEESDKILVDTVSNFDGKIILSGGTTADIIARELNRKIEDTLEFEDPDLPPISKMPGIDLVTEGILTLSKVVRILNNFDQNYTLGKGPADKIVKMLFDSDEIHLLIGTKINEAHQDPNLPVDLEIRRTVIRRLVQILEDKYLKDISIEFI